MTGRAILGDLKALEDVALRAEYIWKGDPILVKDMA